MGRKGRLILGCETNTLKKERRKGKKKRKRERKKRQEEERRGKNKGEEGRIREGSGGRGLSGKDEMMLCSPHEPL